MGFEDMGPKSEGARGGDQLMRNLEREAIDKPDDVQTQERFFRALCQRSRGNDEAAQKRFFSALSKADTLEAATATMNAIFDEHNTHLRGAVVNIEAPAVATGSSATTPEQRWVSWKRVFRSRTEDEEDQSGVYATWGKPSLVEIPGRIEKILRVKLRNAPLEQLIADGHYDFQNAWITADHFPVEDGQGEIELFMTQFGQKSFPGASSSVKIPDVNRWHDANQLRGSTLKELLCIRSQFPEDHPQSFLIGIGQRWQESGGTIGWLPMIHRFDQGDHLYVGSDQASWGEDGLFPAARKPNSRA